jgi:hypothetical protein
VLVHPLTVNAAAVIRVPKGLSLLDRRNLIIACEYVAPPILTSRCDLEVPLRHIQCVVKGSNRKSVCIELKVPKKALLDASASHELRLYAHSQFHRVLVDLGPNFVVRFTELTEEPTIGVESLVSTVTKDVEEGIRAAESWMRMPLVP